MSMFINFAGAIRKQLKRGTLPSRNLPMVSCTKAVGAEQRSSIRSRAARQLRRSACQEAEQETSEKKDTSAQRECEYLPTAGQLDRAVLSDDKVP